MKKIIVAFDGLKYSETTRDQAIFIAKSTASHLVGIFLEDYTYNSFQIYDLIIKKGVSKAGVKKYEEKDKVARQKAINNFEKACQKEGVNYTIHHNDNFAIQELLRESIYADLLVIDSKETMNNKNESKPTEFISSLLGAVQCPVLLVSGKYKPIEKVVLLFDGEPSSVHAVRMFSYIFPTLKQLPTELITVKTMNSNLHVPDNKLMKEFMKRHYPKAVLKVLRGLPETEIANYIKKSGPNSLIVLGAYRRGTVSRWFRESMADSLMKKLDNPMFIAHNR